MNTRFYAVVLVLMLAIPVFGKDVLISNNWLNEWHAMKKSTALHAELIKANVTIPNSLTNGDDWHELSLISNTHKIIGSITISSDGAILRSVSLKETVPFTTLGERKLGTVNPLDATHTAVSFMKDVFGVEINENEYITRISDIDNYGRYAIYFSAGEAKAANIVPMKIEINFQGYAVSYTHLRADEEIITAKPITAPVSTVSSPVFSSNSKDVYWSSNQRWKRLPLWYHDSTPSLAVLNLDVVGKEKLYRPLMDKLPLSLSYTLPSPSPDNTWLVCVINDDVISVIDRNSNTIFGLASRHRLNDRISWSGDSKMIAFSDTNTGSSYMVDLVGSTGIPLDIAEQSFLPEVECASLAFIPGSSDTLIALCRDWAFRNDDNKWRLVRIKTTQHANAPIIEPISDYMEKPFRIQPSYDGKDVWYSSSVAMYELNIVTRKAAQVGWLSEGKTILDEAIINLVSLTWDHSTDGKQIVFTAKLKNGGSAIYIAGNDGNNIKRLSGIDINNECERFFLRENMLWGTVPKSGMKIGLLDNLHYIDHIPAIDNNGK